MHVFGIASLVMTLASADSLRVRLIAPNEARIGDAVPLRLRVENRAGKAIDLYLRGRTITFDVVASREDGGIVWRRLEGEIIPAVVQVNTLASGEVIELKAEWNQRDNAGKAVPAGRYLLRGLLLTDSPEPLESSMVQLRILPRL